jgi:hypothetical protein
LKEIASGGEAVVLEETISGRVQNPPEKKCSGAERLAVFPKK